MSRFTLLSFSGEVIVICKHVHSKYMGRDGSPSPWFRLQGAHENFRLGRTILTNFFRFAHKIQLLVWVPPL